MYSEYEDIVIGLDEIHVNGMKEVLPVHYSTWRIWSMVLVVVPAVLAVQGATFCSRVARRLIKK